MFKNIKTIYRLLAVLSQIKEAYRNYMNTEPKPGIKSTELWGTILAILGMACGFIPPSMYPYVTVLLAAYALARAIAKHTKTTKDDEILDLIASKVLAKLPAATEQPK